MYAYVTSSFDHWKHDLKPFVIDLNESEFPPSAVGDLDLSTGSYFDLGLPNPLIPGEMNSVVVKYELEEGKNEKLMLELKSTERNNPVKERCFMFLKGRGEFHVNLMMPDIQGQEYYFSAYMGEDYRSRIDQIKTSIISL